MMSTLFPSSEVTAVHKANIMKLGDGLFLRSCQEISKMYPNIEFEQMIVDNTTMQVGDILSRTFGDDNLSLCPDPIGRWLPSRSSLT